MNPKIIFYDIDGTLLSETTNKVPGSAVQALRAAKENGHFGIINTGRSREALEPSLLKLGLDGYICGCGTYIEFNQQILYTRCLGNTLSKQIVDDLRHYNLEAVLEGSNTLYYDEENHSPHDEIKRVKEKHLKNRFHVSNWNDNTINFDKFSLWVTADSDYTEFYNKYKDQFEFIDRGNDFYEVVPDGCSKASGIEYLIRHLNIPFENTFAMGDSTNDISMLSYVKNSIAMGNSTPSLFEIVSYRTKDVDQNGLAHALEHYKLI